MVASSGTATVTLPTDEQILITREFEAPRHLVYKAWTTPELVKQWWHGDRGETVSAEIDLRVGGRWRFVGVTHSGFEVAFHGEYRELVPNERIVSTEVYEGAVPDEEDPITATDGTLNTATFAESGGRTSLAVIVDCPSREVRDMIIASGMEVGMQEAMDHLERVAISLA